MKIIYWLDILLIQALGLLEIELTQLMEKEKKKKIHPAPASFQISWGHGLCILYYSLILKHPHVLDAD